MNFLPMSPEVCTELKSRRAPEARIQINARVGGLVLGQVDILLEFLLTESTLKIPLQQVLHPQVGAQSRERRALLVAQLARYVLFHLLMPTDVLSHRVFVLNPVSAKMTLNFADSACVSVLDVLSEICSRSKLSTADLAWEALAIGIVASLLMRRQTGTGVESFTAIRLLTRKGFDCW